MKAHQMAAIGVFVGVLGMAASLQAQEIPDDPVRGQRTMGVGLGLGWNGLAGAGAMCWANLHPHFSVDLGVGLSSYGWKAGGRARLNASTGATTPFVAAGLMYGAGTGDNDVPLETDGNAIRFKVKPTVMGQVAVGVDITTVGGFFFMPEVGWAIRLGGENVEMVSGTPSDVQRQAMDLSYDGGLVIGFTIGFVFGS